MWYLDKEKTQFVHATASKKKKSFARIKSEYKICIHNLSMTNCVICSDNSDKTVEILTTNSI